jgi:hypothetical protein
MNPATIGAVLLAVASGAGGELGKQLWDGVIALVRRPFRREASTSGGAAAAELVTAGDAQLNAFQQTPADKDKAIVLAEVLLARSSADAEFQRALENWWRQAEPVRMSAGNVVNMVSGGTHYGPVLQGRDFSSITFGVAPTPPPVPPPADQGT